MASNPEEIRKHQKLYLLIGCILLIFTGVTVLMTTIDLGTPGVGALDITVGLAIATFKSSLVALIFMHLNSEKKLVYKVLLFTFIFFAGMMTLFVMAKMDPIKFTFYN
ncbi:MAG: cytochrome C oxidase subunit IV family protein [bacterium]|nr:cytochrome C oxidase subunit IV family protein [bacterium]